MIEMENAVVTYPSFELNCSLQVGEGTITGIVGENGAGKTTLFKALLGLVPIASGSAKINGQDIADLSLADRESIGTVLAESFFNDIYTIKDVNRLLKSFYRKFDESYFLRKCADFHHAAGSKTEGILDRYEGQAEDADGAVARGAAADSRRTHERTRCQRATKSWTCYRTTSSPTRSAAS